MKYKIGDILKYNSGSHNFRIIISDIDLVSKAYKTNYIYDNGNIEEPPYPWVDAVLLETWSEYDKAFLRERKLKRILK